jgi:hypothetical protein
MKLKEFYSKLNKNIVETFISYGKTVQYNNDGNIIIDGKKHSKKFKTVEEAKKYCKDQYISEQLQDQVRQEIASDTTTIAKIIREHYSVKVTIPLIESYIEFASSKQFTLDPVVIDLRKTNKLTNLIEGKIDFILDDGNSVALEESTLFKIKNLINNDKTIKIEDMRKSIDKFISVIKKLEEQ